MITREKVLVKAELKAFNHQLQEDVYKDRFMVKLMEESRAEGMSYFTFKLIDKKEPKRNYVIPGWFNKFDFQRHVWGEMNDFIVASDFWRKDKYKPEDDVYFKG